MDKWISKQWIEVRSTKILSSIWMNIFNSPSISFTIAADPYVLERVLSTDIKIATQNKTSSSTRLTNVPPVPSKISYSVMLSSTSWTLSYPILEIIWEGNLCSVVIYWKVLHGKQLVFIITYFVYTTVGMVLRLRSWWGEWRIKDLFTLQFWGKYLDNEIPITIIKSCKNQSQKKEKKSRNQLFDFSLLSQKILKRVIFFSNFHTTEYVLGNLFFNNSVKQTFSILNELV